MSTEDPGRIGPPQADPREPHDEPHGTPAAPLPEAPLGIQEPPAETMSGAEPPLPDTPDPALPLVSESMPPELTEPADLPELTEPADLPEPTADVSAEPVHDAGPVEPDAAALPVEPVAPDPDLPPPAAEPAAPEPAAAPARWRPSRLVKVLIAAGLAVGLLVAGVVAVVAFSVLDPMFGYHPDDDTAAWASHPLRYADTTTCRTCHATEALAVAQDDHARISCETCHGPLQPHVDVATKDDAGPVTVETPPRGICITCHEQVQGRPEVVPQVDLDEHYQGDLCAQCHGVHELVVAKPPLVSHPRNDLPPCVVCHAPDGIRTLPAAHQRVPDDVCLRCHGPGEDRRLLLEGSS